VRIEHKQITILPKAAYSWTPFARSGGANYKRMPILLLLLYGLDIGGGRAFCAAFDSEFDTLALGEGLEAGVNDCREVHEDVLAAVVGGDKAEPLALVEPLHLTSKRWHFLSVCICSLLSLSRSQPVRCAWGRGLGRAGLLYSRRRGEQGEVRWWCGLVFYCRTSCMIWFHELGRWLHIRIKSHTQTYPDTVAPFTCSSVHACVALRPGKGQFSCWVFCFRFGFSFQFLFSRFLPFSFFFFFSFYHIFLETLNFPFRFGRFLKYTLNNF